MSKEVQGKKAYTRIKSSGYQTISEMSDITQIKYESSKVKKSATYVELEEELSHDMKTEDDGTENVSRAKYRRWPSFGYCEKLR